MIGGGVFNLPSDMSRHASPGAIIIGWVITGIGMLMLAFVYQGLAVRKPNLNAGPYAYAKAGFGRVHRFQQRLGLLDQRLPRQCLLCGRHLLRSLLLLSRLRRRATTLASIIGASICLWLIHSLVLNGVKQAAFVNVVTTVAKLVPLFLFVLVGVVAFNWNKFTLRLLGSGRRPEAKVSVR